MDPTPKVVATVVDFSGLLQAARVPEVISSALLAQLGDPSDLRELAFVSGEDWSACVDSLQVLRDPPVALTALSPVEKGKLRLVRKILDMKAGPVRACRWAGALRAPWHLFRPLQESEAVEPCRPDS